MSAHFVIRDAEATDRTPALKAGTTVWLTEDQEKALKKHLRPAEHRDSLGLGAGVSN